MKKTLVLILLLSFTLSLKSQVRCTVVLHDHSIIEATHIGTIDIQKNGHKKIMVFNQGIELSGTVDTALVTIKSFDLIKEISVNNYHSIQGQDPCYRATLTVKYKNGNAQILKNASFKCQGKMNQFKTTCLPFQIKQNEDEYQLMQLEVRNIETILFQ